VITSYVGEPQASLAGVPVQVVAGPFVVFDGAAGIYRFEADGRYGVYWHCSEAGRDILRGFAATAAEAATRDIGCGDEGTAETFTVAGDAEFEDSWGHFQLGQHGSTHPSDESGYLIENVREGIYDLVAGSSDSLVGGANAVYIDRGVTVSHDLVIDIDITQDGVATTTHSLEAEGADTVESTLVTTRGTRLDLGADLASYRALPAAFLEDDDLLTVRAVVDDAGTMTHTQTLRYLAGGDSLTLDLPDPFESAIASATGADPVRMRFDWDAPAGDAAYFFVASQPDVEMQVTVLSGWLEDPGSWQFPDLAEVDGWDDAWGLAGGIEVEWTAVLFQSDAPLAELLDNVPSSRTRASWAGARFDSSNRAGTLVP
jgi:hypothetical protein